MSLMMLFVLCIALTSSAFAQADATKPAAKPAAADKKVSAKPAAAADSAAPAAGDKAAAKPAAAPTGKKKSNGFSIANLDKKVNPCEDFYEYACGNWRKNNPVPNDQVRWGRFNELAETNRDVLHEILEKAKVKSPARTKIEAEVGDFYGACMDEATINKKGAEPLASYFAKIDAVKTKAEMFRLLGEGRSSGMPAFFGFGGGADIHDSNHTVANVSQGGTALPDRDYYLKDDAKSKETREHYVTHVTNMFKLAGESADKAAADAATVMRIETALAKAQLDRVSMRDPKNRDNPMSIEELKKLAPSFDWDSYFSGTGAPWFSRVNVVAKPFFPEVSTLVDATPIDDWKTYERWHVLRGAAGLLSKPFEDEAFDFNNRFLNGAKEQQPRWKRCVGSTDRALGEALGQLYVAKTFGEEGKKRMHAMIDALTAALKEDIENLDWMSAETKTKALVKLRAFNTSKVGFPDKWRDYSSVEIKADDYFGNSRRMLAFETKRNNDRIEKPTDKTEWGMSPPTVNAYYNPSNNEIVFPAGILQPPFFDKTMDDAINYGAVGLVIGHEYTHGFDDQGSKFDPQGNLTNWWTDEDKAKFKERTECVAKEYDEFVVVKDEKNGDVHLNGHLTLGENTADNGGARVAYNALQKALAKDPSKRKNIDGFTPEQRFFLGFADVWCQNSTEQSARTLAKTDPHSDGAHRVIGTVSNMPEFWKAYSCKPGQAMVRGDKACHVW